MVITLAVLVLAVGFFISGKIRSDVVALSALLLLMIFNILSPAEALSGFSNPIVIMMVGLFIVGGGVFQTGLAKVISNKILQLAGNNQTKLFVLIMLATALIGAFVSNTGTVALMLPIVVSLAAGANTSPSRLLMPLAFASSMGGMLTLIGTPPNLVISQALVDAGGKELSFFSFLPVGLICVTIGIVVLLPLSKLFLSKNSADGSKGKQQSLKDLAYKYQLVQSLFRVKVLPESNFANKTLRELKISTKYNVSVLEIRRRISSKNPFVKSVNQKIAGPDTLVEPNDTLYVTGDFEQIQAMVSENGLRFFDAHETLYQSAPEFLGKLRFDEIGIAELVIMSHSKLVNSTIEKLAFREKYRVNILAIQRGNRVIQHNLKDEKVYAGDALLVQGEWKDIALLTDDESEWVVVGQPLSEASKVPIDHKAPLAAIIMIAMIVCMVFGLIPAVAAVLSAAVLMILSGCLRNVEAAYQTINWESIVLIGAMLPMSIALEKTGTSAAVSSLLVENLGKLGPIAVMAGIYMGTSLLTLFISNTATAVLFAPIAVQAAVTMGVSPTPFLFAVTVAASMCFVSPFSTPPNALVMSAGRYKFMDYVKVGGPLQLIYALVMIFALPLLFPF